MIPLSPSTSSNDLKEEEGDGEKTPSDDGPNPLNNAAEKIQFQITLEEPDDDDDDDNAMDADTYTNIWMGREDAYVVGSHCLLSSPFLYPLKRPRPLKEMVNCGGMPKG